METETHPVIIVGAGPAGRAAAASLPGARVVARPAETAWHAEPGRLWIESTAGVTALRFARLLLCADEPLLLMALGCAFAGTVPVVDATGATSVEGVFAAGRILGAATAAEAARQGGIAARAIAGHAPAGDAPGEAIVLPAPAPADAPPARLDPLELAQLLEQPPGPERSRAALAQARARGERLSALVAPARPVGLAALAALARAAPEPRPTQQDGGLPG